MMETIHFKRGNLLQELRRRTIRNFIDILILFNLKRKPMSGYDVITQIFEDFGFLPSSGSIYSTLYSLEREGLIKGYWDGKKRIYTLTLKGKEAARIFLTLSSSIENLILNIFRGGS